MSWTPVKESLPDADTTVIVHCPTASEPIWLGYFGTVDLLDTPRWRDVEGMPIKVTHWQHLPEPPAKKRGK
jgi:hypothetical protein